MYLKFWLPWGQQFLDKECLHAKGEVSGVALEAV